MADLVGFAATTSLGVVVLKWLAPGSDPRIYLSVSGILSTGALGLWHNKRMEFAARRPVSWLRMAAASIVLGGLSFAADALISGGFKAATRLGTPFGFGLTLIICPGFTTMAVGGFARSFLLMRARERSPSEPQSALR